MGKTEEAWQFLVAMLRASTQDSVGKFYRGRDIHLVLSSSGSKRWNNCVYKMETAAKLHCTAIVSLEMSHSTRWEPGVYGQL
jgi:hypothetical protein